MSAVKIFTPMSSDSSRASLVTACRMYEYIVVYTMIVPLDYTRVLVADSSRASLVTVHKNVRHKERGKLDQPPAGWFAHHPARDDTPAGC